MSGEKYDFKTLEQLDQSAGITASDIIEVFQNGKSFKISRKDAIKFDSYDVKVGTTAALTLDDTVATVSNAVAGTQTITLPATLPAGRGRTFVVVIRGKTGTIEWDTRINWSGGNPPVLADNVTVAVLLWDGTAVHGSNGASY